MAYLLNVILSITPNQSVLLLLSLSKTKILSLGNIEMLLFGLQGMLLITVVEAYSFGALI